MTLLFISIHFFLTAGTSLLGPPYQGPFAALDPHETMPFPFLFNISSESTCITSFISPFFLLWRSLCARACKSSSRGLRRLSIVAFSLALGARHLERGLEITDNNRSLRRVNLHVSLKTSNLTASTSRVSISSKTISPVSLNFGIAISRTDCPAGPSIIAVSKAG